MTVEAIVRETGGDRTRLLDVLLAVQEQFGFISDDAIRAISAGLHIHPVEVEDTLSFYAFLKRKPKGDFQVRVSKTPVSLMKGARAVMEAFSKELSAEWTSDIGMADQEPAALINNAVFHNLTPEDVAEIVSGLRARVDVTLLPKAGVLPSLQQAGPVLFSESGAQVGDGVRAALALAPEQVIAEILKAKLRGRGGAGFLTGRKWKLCREAKGEARYVICNADEGEPGTFKDRLLLMEKADLVFDGMAIAAHAIGATKGVLYLRGEYAFLRDSLQEVITRRRKSGYELDIRIQLGAGAYVCGEEFGLIDSLEGKRGAPRERSPYPAEHGFLQQPTAVNNVETYACVARIMERGAAWFSGYGTEESAGTKLFCASGDCERPGVYELPFGITLKDFLDLAGAPDAVVVQVGGPSGQAVSAQDFGRRLAFEDLATGGSMMIFGPQRDVLEIALQFTEFFADESCGWCTPCRVGTTSLKKDLEKIIAKRGTRADLVAIEKLAHTVKRTSRCGLGQTAANPILTTFKSFPEIVEARLQKDDFIPRVSLSEATAEAAEIRRQP